jgi:hypothetical protein
LELYKQLASRVSDALEELEGITMARRKAQNWVERKALK